MNIFSVILDNLWGYDAIIFVAAIVNAALYILARRSIGRLYSLMNVMVFVPEKGGAAAVQKGIDGLREADVVALQRQAGRRYNFFTNLTATFTLLGILGTVISLLPMVADMANMRSNFFAALTSTFWGLVFGIIFKVLDGFLAPRMEDNDRNVALYLERNQSKRA